MEKLRKEIFETLENINLKLKEGEKISYDDFENLFLSAILEEGSNESE